MEMLLCQIKSPFLGIHKDSYDTSALPWYNKISKDVSPMHSGNGYSKVFMRRIF